MRNRQPQRNGFSLVEVVIAMVVLTVGVLAMAATTGQIFTQLQNATRRTERAVAVQQAVEQIRAMNFSDVRDSAMTVGDYRVQWVVQPRGARFKEVELHSIGPGYVTGTGWVDTVRTMSIISLVNQ